MEKESNTKNIETTIRILGQFSPSERDEQPLRFISFENCMRSYLPESKDGRINPIRISAEGNTLAITDHNQNLWILSENFNKPVNISTVVRKKCKTYALNEKQVIMQTKNGHFLLNWGTKKLFSNYQLEEIAISDKSSFQFMFKSYIIRDTTNADSFAFSTMKKVDNTNKLYHFRYDKESEKSQVIGLPSLVTFSVPFKILGVSIGRFHCLCWDDFGHLHSWGSKSIALGYQDIPLESQISQPQRVKSLNCRISCAFAANHYSLALSTEGIIYEWGIKKDANQFNDELIFEPQPLVSKTDTGKVIKFVSLKGKGQNFAAVSTHGSFYIWGKDCTQFIKPTKTKNLENPRLYQPTLVASLSKYKIIDFSLEERYIAVITGDKDSNIMMEEEREYWNEMIAKVKLKWLCNSKRLKTENSNNKENHRFSEALNKNSLKAINDFNSLTQSASRFNSMNGKMYEDKFQALIKENKLKKGYLSLAKNQPSLFEYIMGSSSPKKIAIKGHNFRFKETIQRKQKIMRSQEKSMSDLPEFRKNSTQSLSFLRNSDSELQKKLKKIPTQIQQSLTEVKLFILQNKPDHLQNDKRLNMLLSERECTFHHIKKSSGKPYFLRLRQARSRKKNLDSERFFNTVRKVQENSLQYRLTRTQELQKIKLFEKQQHILKATLQAYLIKSILIRGLCQPLGEARRLKIDNFGLTLKLERKEKLIRKLFQKSKARSSINQLQKLNLKTFLTLCHVFKNYITRRRKLKYERMRKLVVQEIFQSILKEKIRLGMARVHFHVKKLQKFNQWLHLVKKQRIKCLKCRWRAHLLNTMRLHHENQNHLQSKPEDITFRTIYNEKICDNPNLKLENFLNNHSIFSLKFEYFQKIAQLFSDGFRPKSERIVKTLNTPRKIRIKFAEEDKQRGSHDHSMQTGVFQHDILPYSSHITMLVKPPTYQLNIPEAIRNSEKWVIQEKHILNKCLEAIIFEHQLIYLKKRREYDMALAEFIKSKYEKLSEARWKTILEYNQIQKSKQKNRQEKQLKRLLVKVGSGSLLKEDCIPQKYMVLQQALKRQDAPKPPNSFIFFGPNEFRKAFKQYFQMVHGRLIYIKKHG